MPWTKYTGVRGGAEVVDKAGGRGDGGGHRGVNGGSSDLALYLIMCCGLTTPLVKAAGGGASAGLQFERVEGAQGKHSPSLVGGHSCRTQTSTPPTISVSPNRSRFEQCIEMGGQGVRRSSCRSLGNECV